ncbi:bifunctional folylpolyglutamate synthase/dihydrofolate synthase [Syntrophomonas curvata]
MPGLRPGLERIGVLLQAMDNPCKAYPSIHVAGTNGKGSVTLMIASVLQQAGYRVGRFISPHIHSYRERFLINGQEIEENLLKKYLQDIERKLEAIKGPAFAGVTEFELLTALAFKYFKDEQVDLAVLETGLGGTYDSTNVVSPLLSIITGVDYDHQAYLGNSLEEIARNKAGIIKPGVPVIVGDMEREAYLIIEEKASSRNAPLYPGGACRIQRRNRPSLDGQIVDVNGAGIKMEGIPFSLLGDFQLKNLAVAVTALMVLKQQGYNIAAEHMSQALAGLKHPGRMELVSEHPPIMLDVAHNPQAARALNRSLKSLFPGRQRILVCGILDDKDSMAILRELGGDCRGCVVTRPEGERGANWQRLAEQWLSLYPDKEVRIKEEIETAVETGGKWLEAGEYLLVTGSFYVLDRARAHFNEYLSYY